MAKGDGLIVMKPTSIVVVGAGSSASINTDGGVDFTSATSLSLNGVFTAGLENYVIIMRHKLASSTDALNLRLRLSGTDNSTASSYVRQRIEADSTTVAGTRVTADLARISSVADIESGMHLHMYAPGLAQATAMRSVAMTGRSSAYLDDYAVTHNQATAYDGVTFWPGSSSLSGSVVVMGYEE